MVVVSVNPKDTAASVRAAARNWGWRSDGWHWLVGTRVVRSIHEKAA
jgi:hypothetical protein